MATINDRLNSQPATTAVRAAAVTIMRTLEPTNVCSPANDSAVPLGSLMMDIELGQLDALAAAVSEGTFDAAARRLHVTPSAISQRMKALEHSVGAVLLTRTKP